MARVRTNLVEHVIPYTSCHTMASELRRRSVPAWEVQGLMGHKSAGNTEVYAEYDPTYLSKVVKAIDDYFQELNELVGKIFTALNTACQWMKYCTSNLLSLLVGTAGLEPTTTLSLDFGTMTLVRFQQT